MPRKEHKGVEVEEEERLLEGILNTLTSRNLSDRLKQHRREQTKPPLQQNLRIKTKK